MATKLSKSFDMKEEGGLLGDKGVRRHQVSIEGESFTFLVELGEKLVVVVVLVDVFVLILCVCLMEIGDRALLDY